MAGMEKIIGIIDELIFEAQKAPTWKAENALRCLKKELLKEQQKMGHWIVLEFCANEGIYCSECHMKIFDRITKPKEKLSQYCPHCGSRNDQFFRDGEAVFK